MLLTFCTVPSVWVDDLLPHSHSQARRNHQINATCTHHSLTNIENFVAKFSVVGMFLSIDGTYEFAIKWELKSHIPTRHVDADKMSEHVFTKIKLYSLLCRFIFNHHRRQLKSQTPAPSKMHGTGMPQLGSPLSQWLCYCQHSVNTDSITYLCHVHTFMHIIRILIKIKFVSKSSINDIPVLVQVMAWRRLGDKSLSQPMVVSLLTLICVTRPQWVN